MRKDQSVKDVQMKILDIMKYVDELCRQNGITYYIMGGTALGAVRHGGFIPWDDDLDIFMTLSEYKKFKDVFKKDKSDKFIIQEWKTTPDYLEYAKVRMNGTAFIEHNFRDRKDMHQGIYIDIMILHKVPENLFIQKLVYFESKFVTLYALSQRNWKAKSALQNLLLHMLKILPCRTMAKAFYRRIYKYDGMESNYKYCYWITPAKFKNGLFEKDFFETPTDIDFEDTKLICSEKIKEYLEYRYGDYMKLPSEQEQKAAVHAEVYDCDKDYTVYLTEEHMRVQVLCVTMHQTDFSKIDEMNIKTDVIFANQSDRNGYEEKEFDGHIAKMVTTTTRGSGLNRNIAILYSDADIIVLADDDQFFTDGYEDIVISEFEAHPEADAIKFLCKSTNPDRPTAFKGTDKFKRMHKLGIASAGVIALAIKKSSLKESGVLFRNNLGAGGDIFCGEDVVFYKELLARGIKIYSSPKLISYVKQEDSSWFKGYDEKFCYSVGYVYELLYGFLAPLFIIRRIARIKNSTYTKKQMFFMMIKGAKQAKCRK